jgi:hypothetical protein
MTGTGIWVRLRFFSRSLYSSKGPRSYKRQLYFGASLHTKYHQFFTMPSSASTTGRLPANMQNDAFAKVNNLTTPSGGAVVQASYPMNERETDWIYTCPHHIQAIADGVKAGRRLLFSTLGRQAATNALAKLAQCNSSGTETSTPPQSTSDLMHRRVSEYEFGQYTTIVIDTGMHVDGKHNPAKPDELRIKHGVSSPDPPVQLSCHG